MMNEWWKVSAEGLTAVWHCRSSCWAALTFIHCCFSPVRLREEWSGPQQAERVLRSCRGSMFASWCCLKRLHAHSSLSSSAWEASWESLNTYSRSRWCLDPSKAAAYRNFLVERVKESATITKDANGWAYWKNTATLVLLKPDMNRVEQGVEIKAHDDRTGCKKKANFLINHFLLNTTKNLSLQWNYNTKTGPVYEIQG